LNRPQRGTPDSSGSRLSEVFFNGFGVALAALALRLEEGMSSLTNTHDPSPLVPTVRRRVDRRTE